MSPFTINLAPVSQANHTRLSQCTRHWQGPNKPGTLSTLSFSKLKYMALSKDTHTHTPNKGKTVPEGATNAYCRRRGIALFILNLGTRWIHVISFDLQPLYPRRKVPPVGIKYEAWWVPQPDWSYSRETSQPQAGYWNTIPRSSSP
jgi:hypothetical protein